MRVRIYIFNIILSCFVLVTCRANNQQTQKIEHQQEEIDLVHPPAIELPELIESPKIDYPAEANFYGKDARVHVSATIDQNGEIIDVKILKSPNVVFNRYADSLAYKFKFKPGTIDGTPAKLTISWPIIFKYSGN